MNPMSVLVVDDERDFLETLVNRLKKRKIDPACCFSGEEALETMKNRRFDIVILDVQMSGMNGIEVLRRIKEDYPKTEVIMLTGHASVGTGVEGIKTGAFDYLIKPVEIDQLIVKIRQAYEKTLREQEKRREAEFRARVEQQMIITERLASLGTLAVGLAHEINNPLQIMKSEKSLMKMILSDLAENGRLDDSKDLRELGNSIERFALQIERCAKITQAILKFGSKSEPSTTEVDTRTFIPEVIGMISKEASVKGISIEYEIRDTAPPIQGNPALLQQALLNLFNNAIDAVTMRHGSRGGKLLVAAEVEEDRVRIDVRDSGCGISPENLERIFSPFFTTKPVGKGTGLGLSVCYGIVKSMGGEISVSSEIGVGTRFTIYLPAAQEGHSAKIQDRPLSPEVHADGAVGG